mgnify:CR=1 FL=1
MVSGLQGFTLMDQKSNQLKNEYLEISRLYLEKLRRQRIPVVKAYLFGSRAKGKASKWSDLDLCVISPIFGHDRQGERVRLMNLCQGISDLIEPHPYSPTDFENEFDSLAREIKRTGIIVS